MTYYRSLSANIFLHLSRSQTRTKTDSRRQRMCLRSTCCINISINSILTFNHTCRRPNRLLYYKHYNIKPQTSTTYRIVVAVDLSTCTNSIVIGAGSGSPSYVFCLGFYFRMFNRTKHNKRYVFIWPNGDKAGFAAKSASSPNAKPNACFLLMLMFSFLF